MMTKTHGFSKHSVKIGLQLAVLYFVRKHCGKE